MYLNLLSICCNLLLDFTIHHILFPISINSIPETHNVKAQRLPKVVRIPAKDQYSSCQNQP